MNQAIETMILAQEKLVLLEFSSVRSLVVKAKQPDENGIRWL